MKYEYKAVRDLLDECYEDEYNHEVSLIISEREYMILLSEDYCAFLRCEDNAKMEFSGIEELCSSTLFDGIVLKDDCDKIKKLEGYAYMPEDKLNEPIWTRTLTPQQQLLAYSRVLALASIAIILFCVVVVMKNAAYTSLLYIICPITIFNLLLFTIKNLSPENRFTYFVNRRGVGIKSAGQQYMFRTFDDVKSITISSSIFNKKSGSARFTFNGGMYTHFKFEVVDDVDTLYECLKSVYNGRIKKG